MVGVGGGRVGNPCERWHHAIVRIHLRLVLDWDSKSSCNLNLSSPYTSLYTS
jgi:hypothetical protein